MKRYDLSKIMRGAHNAYRTGKYTTFSDALKRSWQVAKFNARIQADRAETEAVLAERKRMKMEHEAWVNQVRIERASRRIQIATPVKERNSVLMDYKPCSIWSMNTNYTGD